MDQGGHMNELLEMGVSRVLLVWEVAQGGCDDACLGGCLTNQEKRFLSCTHFGE